MTPENFIYWLQGFVELSDRCPTEKEWLSIKNHLNLVFTKSPITYPIMPEPYKPAPQPYVITC